MAITVTAGTAATATAFNNLVPKYIKKSADEIVNNSVTMQNDNDFSAAALTFGANETWVLELYLEITGAEAADFACDWAVTSTLLMTSRHILNMSAAGTDSGAATVVGIQVRNTTEDVSCGVDASVTTRTSYREVCAIESGASGGTLQFRWCQNTLTASDTTVKGTTSFLIGHRVL